MENVSAEGKCAFRVRRNKLDRVAGQQASRVAASVSQPPSWSPPWKSGAPHSALSRSLARATIHANLVDVDEAKP
jgi:hypothetical protein